MVFVAVVLACLGVLMIAGFVLLYVQIGALADELRTARKDDAISVCRVVTAAAQLPRHPSAHAR